MSGRKNVREQIKRARKELRKLSKLSIKRAITDPGGFISDMATMSPRSDEIEDRLERNAIRRGVRRGISRA